MDSGEIDFISRDEYRDFVAWCLDMAEIHGGDYCRVKSEIMLRFPQVVDLIKYLRGDEACVANKRSKRS